MVIMWISLQSKLDLVPSILKLQFHFITDRKLSALSNIKITRLLPIIYSIPSATVPSPHYRLPVWRRRHRPSREGWGWVRSFLLLPAPLLLLSFRRSTRDERTRRPQFALKWSAVHTPIHHLVKPQICILCNTSETQNQRFSVVVTRAQKGALYLHNQPITDRKHLSHLSRPDFSECPIGAQQSMTAGCSCPRERQRRRERRADDDREIEAP